MFNNLLTSLAIYDCLNQQRKSAVNQKVNQ